MDDSIRKQFDDVVAAQNNLRGKVGEIDAQIVQLAKRLKKRANGPVEKQTPPEPRVVPVAADPPKLIEKPKPASVPVLRPKEVSAKPPALVKDPAAPAANKPAPAVDREETTEMHLGRFWLVRAGVVMLLGGLVFLAEYARKTWWVDLPALAKIVTFYLGSFGMLAAGLRWEKRRLETRQFGRVLAAGGAAAVYYTTYAAHYVSGLRVIESPIIGALLLLLWAAVLVWDSRRRDSQGMAIAGLLLAYFTCIIGEPSSFSYCSALVLTIGGALLTVRQGWKAVGTISMIASYLCFAYWRLPSMLDWNSAAVPSWFGSTYVFLIGYWVIFSVAYLLPRSGLSIDQRVTGMATNNGAFLALFSFGVFRHLPDFVGEFWMIAGLVIGAVAVASARLHAGSRLPLVHAVSSVLVFTAGLCEHFSGAGLALALALEGSVLAVVSRLLPGKRAFLIAPALLLAKISLLLALNAGATGLLFTQALLWAITAVMLRRWGLGDDEERQKSGTLVDLMALSYWGIVTVAFSSALLLCEIGSTVGLVWFGGAMLVFTVALHTRFSWLQYGAAVYGLLAPIVAFGNPLETLTAPASGIFWLLVAGFAFAARVTSRRLQGIGDVYSVATVFLSAVAMVLSGIEFTWEQAWPWVLVPTLLSAFWYAGAGFMKLPAMAATALWFPVMGLIALMLSQTGRGDTSLPALLLVIECAGLWALVRFSRFSTVGSSKQSGELLSALFCMLAFLIWSSVQFSPTGTLLVRALTGLVILVAATGLRSRSLAWPAVALLAVAGLNWLVEFAEAWDGTLSPVLIGLCVVPVLAGRLLTRENWCAQRGGGASWIFGMSASLMVFLLATRLADSTFSDGAFTLPAAWAFTGAAVFFLGMGLRERVYRVSALTLLAMATAHVLLVDVWKLETLGRVASFSAVGIVLVLLGFFYNRYGDRIRAAR